MFRDLLPDCRSPSGRGSSPGPWGQWVPIYCANCHREGGKVPAEGTTFIFWLCDKCQESCGQVAATLAVPDEEYYANLRREQREEQLHREVKR